MVQRTLPIPQLQQLLRERLKTASSVALLGVGSELRGDDAVGMSVAKLLDRPERLHPRLRIHYGSTAPESVTGPIRSQDPSHLIIVDAAALGHEPGAIALLERQDIGGITFCTHALPLSVIIDFICHRNPALDAFVLAVQAEHMLFAEPLSEPVEQAAKTLADVLLESLPSK